MENIVQGFKSPYIRVTDAGGNYLTPYRKLMIDDLPPHLWRSRPLRDNETPVVRPYVLVDDINAAVSAASEAGATLRRCPKIESEVAATGSSVVANYSRGLRRSHTIRLARVIPIPSDLIQRTTRKALKIISRF